MLSWVITALPASRDAGQTLDASSIELHGSSCTEVGLRASSSSAKMPQLPVSGAGHLGECI
jgi:hypothetical protein